METPKEILPHAADYTNGAWKNYTFEELNWWTRLLAKRATHRTDPVKAQKDLTDAANYLAMYIAKSEALMEEMKLKVNGEPVIA